MGEHDSVEVAALSDSKGSWEPSVRVARLLFVDFDGVSANPDDVISEGLDGGYRDRTEELAEMLRDPEEDPWRFRRLMTRRPALHTV